MQKYKPNPARRLCAIVSIFVLTLFVSDSASSQEQLKQFLKQAANQIEKPSLDPESLDPLQKNLEALLDKIQTRKYQTQPEVQHFINNVKPVLEQKCFSCHSPDLSMAELDLSAFNKTLKGGSRGPSVVPGDPDESLLFQLITHLREPKMPQGMDKLSDEEIEHIRLWIEQGALYDTPPETKAIPEETAQAENEEKEGTAVTTGVVRPDLKKAQLDFWSFQPLQRHEPPQPVTEDWVQTPIDNFILAKMESNGVQPAPQASKQDLIRRLYFDLTGLPPTPKEVNEFINNDSPAAYKELVNELLASKRFGERWARHWLDVARYADSTGYEFDYERPNAYPYRDFVIKALNQDMPYDKFIKWQLAGDEYAPENPQALAATGFNTAGAVVSNQEAEINRYNELDDMVSTTSQAFLGLTVACARCHDHKFDPISQYDYYRLTAFYTSSKREVRYLASQDEIDKYEALIDEHEDTLRDARQRLREFENQFKEPLRNEKIDALPVSLEDKVLLKLPAYDDVKEQKALLEKYEDKLKITEDELLAQLSQYDRNIYHYLKKHVEFIKNNPPKELPKGLTLTDQDPEPVLSYFLHRGEPGAKQALVEPGFISVLTPPELEKDPPWFVDKPMTAKTTYRRTALAEWITDEEQGAGALTYRVYVNRIWQHLMGEGIVKTPNDFGFQGERPTHPELLDWLATELNQNNGSTKHLIRLIVNSAVYKQGPKPPEMTLAMDPENEYWSRRPLKRLEAEIQRDAILAISGSLNDKMFGPGVKPYMDPDAIATGSTGKWPKGVEDGPETWRRSIYMFTRRSVLHPLMSQFDAPDATSSCARRVETIVPTQALTFLNDKFMREQSSILARRIIDECGSDDTGKCIERLFKLALSRTPNSDELDESRKFLQEQKKRYENHQPAQSTGQNPTLLALTDLCQSVINLNEFVYIQ